MLSIQKKLLMRCSRVTGNTWYNVLLEYRIMSPAGRREAVAR